MYREIPSTVETDCLTDLDLRDIVKVSTEGNCCWKIYSKTGYRGQKQLLQLDYNEPPNFSTIRSIKKVPCA